jgi:hypothetical protein
VGSTGTRNRRCKEDAYLRWVPGDSFQVLERLEARKLAIYFD